MMFPRDNSPSPSPVVPVLPVGTTELDHYMRIAMQQVYSSAPSEIFKPSAAFPVSTLRKDVVNTIIAFGGAFNPPHIGHKLLLTYTFSRSSLPNAVAATIMPKTTANVAKKLRRLGEPGGLVFQVSERAMPWHDDLLVP
jgi:hypothetical protein